MGCDNLKDGRGVAIADLNGDGRLDVVISNNAAPPTIYLNNQDHTANWLRLNLIGRGPRSCRDALGARVQVTVLCGGQLRTMTRWVEAGSGYASQSEFTLHFGLGDAPAVESLVVTWAGGTEQRFERAELTRVLNETISINQGTARLTRIPPASCGVSRASERGHDHER